MILELTLNISARKFFCRIFCIYICIKYIFSSNYTGLIEHKQGPITENVQYNKCLYQCLPKSIQLILSDKHVVNLRALDMAKNFFKYTNNANINVRNERNGSNQIRHILCRRKMRRPFFSRVYRYRRLVI